MRDRVQVEIVLVAQMGPQREAAGCVRRPAARLRLAACDAAAEVEQGPDDRGAERRRRLRSRLGGADEPVSERRYVPATERIRSAIASTLGMIASSSGGL